MMLTLLETAIGGAVFSLLASLMYFTKVEFKKPKSRYQEWLDEAKEEDVIHKGYRRPESRVHGLTHSRIG